MINICKVKIIDAICGAGKTEFSIQLMNSCNPLEEKFIYITPFLSEVERIRKNVKTFKFYEPDSRLGKGSKYNNFKDLLLEGKNIVSTHSLFTNINTDILETIKLYDYTLILDEVIEVTENIKVSCHDWEMLMDKGHMTIEEKTNKIIWLNDKYTGDFYYIKQLAESNNLYLHTRTSEEDDKNKILLVWTFPIEIFQAFKSVYNLTYMFDGQLQKYYFDMYNLEYEYKSVQNINGKYQLVEYNNRLDNRERFKQLINIYEGNLNAVGEDYYSLSRSWLEKARKNNTIKVLKNNTYNYFKNIIKSKSKFNMWTTLKGYDIKEKKDKIRLALSDKGYSRGFIPVTTRATNEYIEKNCCAYLVNRFLNPIDKGFFEDKGINVNESVWALSELIQWLFRSSIRKSEPINLYIPSSRMRQLLYDWIEYKL